MSHRLGFPRIYAKFSDDVSLFQELFPISRLDGTLASYNEKVILVLACAQDMRFDDKAVFRSANQIATHTNLLFQ